jgi:hypothetical protein
MVSTAWSATTTSDRMPFSGDFSTTTAGGVVLDLFE